jgi:hypothetical protein
VVRHYDPASGPFISPDPFKGTLNAPQSQHPYIYCKGNPIKYSDSSGYAPPGSIPPGAVKLKNEEDYKALAKSSLKALELANPYPDFFPVEKTGDRDAFLAGVIHHTCTNKGKVTGWKELYQALEQANKEAGADVTKLTLDDDFNKVEMDKTKHKGRHTNIINGFLI